MSDRRMAGQADLTCDDVRELAAPFVLGALDEVQAEAVRAHLASCSDTHHEIAELGGVLPALDLGVPQLEPSAALRSRILAAAAADTTGRPATRAAATIGQPEPMREGAPTRLPVADERARWRAGASRSSSTSTAAWFARIAAVLAIALLGGWNLLLQGQLGEARTHEQNLAAVVAAAGRPGALTAVLRPVGASDRGAGLAAVGTDGSIVLAMHDLAPTPAASVYEAWAMGSDGVPRPLGSFRVGSAGIGYLEATSTPDANVVLALTREPAPGATVPTTPIVSSGTTTRAG